MGETILPVIDGKQDRSSRDLGKGIERMAKKSIL